MPGSGLLDGMFVVLTGTFTGYTAQHPRLLQNKTRFLPFFVYRTHRTARHVHVLRQRLDILSVYRSVYHGIAESKRGEGAPSLFIDPLQQCQPLGEKGLGLGVMQPKCRQLCTSFCASAAGEVSMAITSCMVSCRVSAAAGNIRQRRQRVLPHKGRQQLHRHGQAGNSWSAVARGAVRRGL